MESRKNVVAATIQNQNTAFKPADCPGLILKLVSARKIAFEAYPNSPHFKGKIEMIAGLTFIARRLLNEHPAIIANTVLSLESRFLLIAPSENSKMRKTYMDKLRTIILTCKNFKALKTQRHA